MSEGDLINGKMNGHMNGHAVKLSKKQPIMIARSKRVGKELHCSTYVVYKFTHTLEPLIYRYELQRRASGEVLISVITSGTTIPAQILENLQLKTKLGPREEKGRLNDIQREVARRASLVYPGWRENLGVARRR